MQKSPVNRDIKLLLWQMPKMDTDRNGDFTVAKSLSFDALPPKKKQRVRTYDEYIKLGFTQCPSDVTKPRCLLGFKALSNDAMKPSKT